MEKAATTAWGMATSTGTVKRPYRIQRDVDSLKRDKPVSKILQSSHFKQELENILMGQLSGSGDREKAIKSSLKRYQDNTVPPPPPFVSPFRHQHSAASPGVIPIDDLRGANASKYSLEEKHIRCKLAACYRLIQLRGWDIGIYGHITARAPGAEETFFLNPLGLHYSEITASSLARVDLDGNIIDPGSTQLGVNKAGYVIHSAIHAARKDVKCIVHIHTCAGVAVSAMAFGLLPISQDALAFSGVSYHDFRGVACDVDEKAELARDFGPVNKIMILRNHGLVAVGSSIEEAFYNTYNLVMSCQIQVAALSAGLANLIMLDGNLLKRTSDVLNKPGGGVTSVSLWKPGELEYEAEMRVLDHKGYNTGYPYKGMHLLVPEPDPNKLASYNLRMEARRKKRQERKKAEQEIANQQQQQHEVQSDPWKFLDKRTAEGVGNDHSTKQTSKTNGSEEGLWDFLDTKKAEDLNPGAPHVDASKTAKPQEILENGFDSNLTSLQRAQLTAQAVAHSTGQAVQKLSQHQQSSQEHSQSEFQPGMGAKPFQKHADNFAHSTPVSTSSQPPHATALMNGRPSNHLSPIERAIYTAEQVAESTGEAVQKLSQSLSDTKVS